MTFRPCHLPAVTLDACLILWPLTHTNQSLFRRLLSLSLSPPLTLSLSLSLSLSPPQVERAVEADYRQHLAVQCGTQKETRSRRLYKVRTNVLTYVVTLFKKIIFIFLFNLYSLHLLNSSREYRYSIITTYLI